MQAAPLPERHGLPEAAVLQLRDHVEVSKLRKNLAEEYLRYLSERDARKILIADLNELRYQREDMSLAQSPGIWGEDPVKLTLALKMARQDLTRTQM